MNIGFIKPYDATHSMVWAHKTNAEDISDMSVIPEHITLPDYYAPQPGMLTLVNIETGELSYIHQEAPPTPGDEIVALKAEVAAQKERQAISEAALNELIDLTLGGGA